MATLNLGAIRYNWKGAYNGSTAYVVNDVVSANGNSYICIQAGTGQAVGNATAYWNIMSSAGTNGTNGTDVGTTITTQGDILYRDGSGLQRLAAGTSGQVLQTGGSGANPSWTDASSGKLLQAVVYETTNRNSISSSASDQAVFTWTSGFVKQSATSKLYIWNENPTHGSNSGSQQVMQLFTHSDSTATQVFGSRRYSYSGNNNATIIGMQGVATGLKVGTYSIVLKTTSAGNANNGDMIFNPNANEDSRYERSTDAQGTSGQDGSKSTLIIQEIEV